MAKIGYFNNATDDTGNPKAATITVYNAGTAVLATIYADAGGTIVKDNPFITDVLGRFQFFAASGAYDIEVSGTGITTYKIEYEQLSNITKSQELSDMPASLAGQAGKGLRVNSGGTAYEHFLRNFLSLTDVPATYSGQAAKVVRVKAAEDGLEFYTLPSSSIPSGLIALFDAACPSGWTRVSAWDGKYLKGAASYGGTGGALTHAHGAGTYALVHTHQVDPPSTTSGVPTAVDSKPVGTLANDAADNYVHKHVVDIAAFTSGAASTSAVTGSSETVNHEPPYIEVIFCKKD